VDTVETLIERIAKAPGVTGAFLATPGGELLGMHNPPSSKDTLGKAAWTLGRSIEGAERLGMSVDDLNLYCEEERVMVRKIGGNYLYLFTHSKINLVLLDLSVGLDMDDLVAVSAVQKPISAPPAIEAPPPPPPKPPERTEEVKPTPAIQPDREVVEDALSRVRGPRTVQVPKPVAAAPVATEPEEKIKVGPPPPKPKIDKPTEAVPEKKPAPAARKVGTESVSRIKHELTKVMGPMASIIFSEAAAQVEFDETSAEPADLKELIKVLSGEIPDVDHRTMFTEKLSNLV
jgi:hypothetical protein